jgi:hypothetical protein
MAKAPSPYRMLSAERRLVLVTHAVRASRENRAMFIRRLVDRPGGYRPVTLQSWPPDKLAREIVRLRAESAQDELDLLQLLYVELEPQIQSTFLDAAGVKHEGGAIDDSLEPPYATAAGVRKGADAVRAAHGADGEHYLRTIARYSREWWPGVDEIVAGMGEATAG